MDSITGRVVLIDLGLSGPKKEGEEEASEIIGSLYFISVRVHEKKVPTPEDDLESLAYVFLHLHLKMKRIDLYWNCTNENDKES